MSAIFGVLSGSGGTRERVFLPQIRLGSPAFDNYHGGTGGGFRPGNKILLPFDYDAGDRRFSAAVSDSLPSPAVRQIIWEAVSDAYKASVDQLERLRADERVNAARDDRTPDFSAVPATTAPDAAVATASIDADMYGPSDPRDPERPATGTEGLALREMAANSAHDSIFAAKVKLYSAVFSPAKGFTAASASIDHTVQRKYFVDTEGTLRTQDRSGCRLMVSATIRTADGMDLPLNNSYFAFTPEGLPSDDEVLADTEKLAATLLRMADSPIVAPFTGPAILSGEAAGVFFHEIFGHRVEGQRMKSDADGQTFKKMVGCSVLPRHFSVIDDPTLSTFGDADLFGHYLFDDQGVAAERVDIVRDGVLRDFLMTRVPIDATPAGREGQSGGANDQFSHSNGHARASESLDPVSRQSNLIISTSEPLTDTKLRKELIRAAKAQKCEFGLYFKQVTGGFTQTGRYSPNSFNVTPLEVYKIYVDGRPDELVRGVDLIGTPLSMFDNIVLAGGEYGIFTGFCGAESGYVPVTAVSPAILVRKVEVQRKAKNSATPPVLPTPPQTAEAICKGEKIPLCDPVFAAMRSELRRGMDSLYRDGKPFWIGFLLADVRALNVSATLGEVISSNMAPQKMIGTRVLLGDSDMTSDLSYSGSYNVSGAARETNPDEIRREFWLATDAAYKRATQDLARKKAIRNQENLSYEESRLPDWLPVEPVEKFIDGPRFELDQEKSEDLARTLSAIYTDYPQLYGSRVNVAAYDWTNYAVDSDGTAIRTPSSFAYVSTGASVQTDDGEEFSQSARLYAVSDLTLPTQDSLKNWVRAFAGRLAKFAAAPKFGRFAEFAAAPRIETFYSGPVLFVGQPVFKMFDDNLLSNDGNGLLVKRMPAGQQGATSPRRLAARVRQRVLDSKIYVCNYIAFPSMREWNGTPLLGYYEADADGSASPGASMVIDGGVLTGLLSSRIPTLDQTYSTGSNRFSVDLNPYIAPGVLEVSTSQNEGRTIKQLEAQLIKLAAADGLEVAYIVEEMAGRVDIVWQVDVATGARTMVRDADVTPVSLKQLRRIAGVSSESEMRNYLAGQVPATMIYPRAVLLEDVEIGVAQNQKQKPSPIKNPLSDR